jgi:hypothetical protein
MIQAHGKGHYREPGAHSEPKHGAFLEALAMLGDP